MARARPSRTAPSVEEGGEASFCEYCGQEITDPGLGFLEHIEDHPSCRFLWDQFRQNARREAGET